MLEEDVVPHRMWCYVRISPGKTHSWSTHSCSLWWIRLSKRAKSCPLEAPVLLREPSWNQQPWETRVILLAGGEGKNVSSWQSRGSQKGMDMTLGWMERIGDGGRIGNRRDAHPEIQRNSSQSSREAQRGVDQEPAGRGLDYLWDPVPETSRNIIRGH